MHSAINTGWQGSPGHHRKPPSSARLSSMSISEHGVQNLFPRAGNESVKGVIDVTVRTGMHGGYNCLRLSPRLGSEFLGKPERKHFLTPMTLSHYESQCLF